jgi:hypothetical protein
LLHGLPILVPDTLGKQATVFVVAPVASHYEADHLAATVHLVE